MKINFTYPAGVLPGNTVQNKNSSPQVNRQTENSVPLKYVLNFGTAYPNVEDISSIKNRALKAKLKNHVMSSLGYDEKRAEEFVSKVKFSSNPKANEKLVRNIKEHTTPDIGGDLPIHYADFEKVKKINKMFANQPEILKTLHTTPDIDDNLSIHFAGLEEMKEIHKMFENQPELLKTLHTTPNIDGDLPIHYAGLEEMKEIHKLFANQPEILKTLHTTPNSDGELPIHLADMPTLLIILELVKKLVFDTPELPCKDIVELMERYKRYDSDIRLALEYPKTTTKKSNNTPLRLVYSAKE